MVVQDLSDRFKVLSHQETFYQCKDYLKLRKDATLKQSVDETCRYTMANWCYQVLDYCNASEETGSVAMSYVDRFLSTKQGSFVLNDKKWFQLLVMSSLQLAIKVQESKKLEIDILADLSRGMFSVEDINLMEKALLSALSWRLCSATPYVFLDLFLELLPTSISNSTKLSLRKLSKKQIYLTLPHYTFALQKSSAIACAALLNSMDEFRCSLEDIKVFRSHLNCVGFKYSDGICLSLRKDVQALINPRPNEFYNDSVPCSESRKDCTSAPIRVRQACR